MTEPTPTPTIPEDLQNKLKSLYAIGNTFKLLEQGMFTYHVHDDVSNSLKFLQSLYDQVLSDAQKHPQAHLVKGLINKTEEQTDGQV